MEPRISLITLGVSDVAAATAFYERIGFTKSGESNAEVSFFQLNGGLVLALWGRAHLAADMGAEVREAGFSGVSLAHNTRSALEVDRLTAAFVAAGGRLLKAPERTFWGGYSGYASDPDGHAWEIAHNPFWELDQTGGIKLPAPAEIEAQSK